MSYPDKCYKLEGCAYHSLDVTLAAIIAESVERMLELERFRMQPDEYADYLLVIDKFSEYVDNDASYKYLSVVDMTDAFDALQRIWTGMWT